MNFPQQHLAEPLAQRLPAGAFVPFVAAPTPQRPVPVVPRPPSSAPPTAGATAHSSSSSSSSSSSVSPKSSANWVAPPRPASAERPSKRPRLATITKADNWVGCQVVVGSGKYAGIEGTVLRSGHGFYCVLLPSGHEIMKRAGELVRPDALHLVELPLPPLSSQGSSSSSHASGGGSHGPGDGKSGHNASSYTLPQPPQSPAGVTDDDEIEMAAAILLHLHASGSGSESSAASRRDLDDRSSTDEWPLSDEEMPRAHSAPSRPSSSTSTYSPSHHNYAYVAAAPSVF